MASLKSDVERMVKELCRDHECTAKLTRRGHWRVSRPGHQPISMARTPSDQRALNNMRADVAKFLGVDL